jgi:hypothetical protein
MGQDVKNVEHRDAFIALAMHTAVFLFGFALSAAAYFGFGPGRYVIRYGIPDGVPTRNVVVDKKPHDCEYDTAPAGNKNCVYKPQVEKSGNRYFVTWEKVDE